ncbi:MAG TPA: (2Fe-2S)-binding protein [Bryobacteraceae bacterium]|nr:(2Fe-2S)-binding protein [Bryobacteraceae bacterium]
MRRRGFLSTFGASVVGVTVAGKATAAPATTVAEPGAPAQVALTVNGQRHRVAVEPRWTLLYVLREKIGVTGAKAGCERGECGACTVLIDGVARYACLTLAVEADGREITTVEGLLHGEQLGPVQHAFVEEDGLQCGYCTSGQVMAAEALLRKTPNPGIDEIRQGMSGNLCRCGAYSHIFKAVQRAAELKTKEGVS